MTVIQDDVIYECNLESAESSAESSAEFSAEFSNKFPSEDSNVCENEVFETSYSFYPSLLSMVADTRKYVFWLTILLSFSVVLGYFFGLYNPSFIETLLDLFVLPEHTTFELAVYIFLNNTRVAALLVFFGFIFALLPVFIVFFNGMTIGIVSEWIIREEGLLFLIVGLLPHGIIEIPAILFSAGIGFKMGVGALQVLFRKKPLRAYLHDFLTAAGIFVLIILPLLLAAAFIESYVTGFLLEYIS